VATLKYSGTKTVHQNCFHKEIKNKVISPHNLIASPYIRVIKSRMMRWAVHTARMGEMKNANKILVGRPEGNRLLGRSKRGWEANIRMNLIKYGGGCGRKSSGSAQVSMVASCERGNAPSCSITGGEFD
jgi:hypothetical protein